MSCCSSLFMSVINPVHGAGCVVAKEPPKTHPENRSLWPPVFFSRAAGLLSPGARPSLVWLFVMHLQRASCH